MRHLPSLAARLWPFFRSAARAPAAVAPGAPRRPALAARAAAWPTVLGLLLLAGCGGGVGTGGTGSFASGPVTGFGSVIVGGVAWDDAAAQRLDEDGAALPAAFVLGLGMTLDVQGGTPGGDGSEAAPRRALADSLRLRSALRGPVDSVEAGGRRLRVLGQRVELTAATAVDAALPGGVAALRPGDGVVVHGLVGDDGVLATRIDAAPAGAPRRLRGRVAAVDGAARTLRIGDALLDLRGLAALPAGLDVGAEVQATLQPALGGAALFAVQRLEVLGAAGDGTQLWLDGVLTPAARAGASWALTGRALDLSAASIQPAGAALVAGAFVSLEGTQRGETIAVQRLQVLGRGGLEARALRVDGPLTAWDAGLRRGSARGVAIDFATASFVNGDVSRLAVGAVVRVTGPLSADGTLLQARRVVFD